jgi:hypothetical protein
MDRPEKVLYHHIYLLERLAIHPTPAPRLTSVTSNT